MKRVLYQCDVEGCGYADTLYVRQVDIFSLGDGQVVMGKLSDRSFHLCGMHHGQLRRLISEHMKLVKNHTEEMGEKL